MIVLIPLLVCLAGALIYGISANGKAQALALHMFWTGLFITLWGLQGVFTTVIRH